MNALQVINVQFMFINMRGNRFILLGGVIIILSIFLGIRIYMVINREIGLLLISAAISALVSLILGYFLYHRLGIERIKIEKTYSKRVDAYLDLYKTIVGIYGPAMKIREYQRYRDAARNVKIFSRFLGDESRIREAEVYEAMAKDLENMDKEEFFRKLIDKMYAFHSTGKTLFLSDDLKEYVWKLVRPKLENPDISIEEYEKRISLKDVIELFSKIENRVEEDLKLDEINKRLS